MLTLLGEGEGKTVSHPLRAADRFSGVVDPAHALMLTQFVPADITDPKLDNSVATDETDTDGLFQGRFEGKVER